MKAALWYNNRDIRLEEVPTPSPSADEILVKVHACGICGSDIVEWYRLPRAPLVQGHEIGAEVVSAGRSVEGFRPGDRVFIAPKVPCMNCEYCRKGQYPVCSEVKGRLPGGFAELILVPRDLVEKGTYDLPESISYDKSTFIEPLACVVRAQNLAGADRAERILVLGSGMSGLLHIKMARARGQAAIAATDTSRKRLGFASRTGANPVIPAEEDVPRLAEQVLGGKADLVLVCTSALSALEQAWQSVDKGGTVVLFAVPGPDEQAVFPANDFWRKEIRVLTSYYCGPSDIQEAMALLERKTVEVEDLITHRFPLCRIEEGFRLVMEGEESIKVIIHPNEGD